MNKRIIISETERERILSQHKNLIQNESELKKQSISEREMSNLINKVLIKESSINETLSGPSSGNALNACGTGSQLCWACTPIANGPAGCPTQSGVYMGWSIADQNTASGCGCTAWSFGMPIPGQSQKLPKPATTTTTTTTTTPKPISTTTTKTAEMKEEEVEEQVKQNFPGARPGDSCNCGSKHGSGVIKCDNKVGCWCDCSNPTKID